MPRQSIPIPDLPNELIVAIFNACPLNEHVALLRVSKHFHNLGLKPLYRSIWINSPIALKKLSETLSSNYGYLTRTLQIILIFPSRDLYWHSSKTIYQKQLYAVLTECKNVQRLQVYAPDLLIKEYTSSTTFNQTFWMSKINLSKSITSLTIGVTWSQLSVDFLNPLSSLIHLSIQLSGTYDSKYDQNSTAVVTLPNLQSYHGPTLLLQSLAQGSPHLASLVLELRTPQFFTDEPTGKGPTLEFLSQIGSENADGLTFLKIVCDKPIVANQALQFLPNVSHLSLMCTDITQEWVISEDDDSATGSTPPDPWHGSFDLDFLSDYRVPPSLHKFSLSFVHSRTVLPWDLDVVADSLGKKCSQLDQVILYGRSYRKSSGSSWSRV